MLAIILSNVISSVDVQFYQFSLPCMVKLLKLVNCLFLPARSYRIRKMSNLTFETILVKTFHYVENEERVQIGNKN